MGFDCVPHGHALVSKLAQGNLMLDHNNTPQPVRIIDNHSCLSSIFAINFLAFGSFQQHKSIPCVSNQLLSLRASAVKPALYHPASKPVRADICF